MPSLTDSVRLTISGSACWQQCHNCGEIAPLAPDQPLCRQCRPSTCVPRRRSATGKRRRNRK